MKSVEVKSQAIPFFMVPVEIFDDSGISPFEKLVYCGLRRYADTETGKCFPSLKTVATMIGVSRKTIQRALDGLTAKGWISRTLRREEGKKEYTSTLYTIFISRNRDTSFTKGMAPQTIGMVPQTIGYGPTDPVTKFRELNKSGKRFCKECGKEIIGTASSCGFCGGIPE